MKKSANWLRIAALAAALIVLCAASGVSAARAALFIRPGTNLLPDSGRERTAANGFVSYPVRDVLQDYVGRQVTVSFDIKGAKGQSILIYAYQESGVSLTSPEGGTMTLELEKDDEYARVSFPCLVKDFGQKYASDGSALSAGALAFFDTAAEKRPFTVRMVKIELGEEATPWTPSDNDPALGENLLPGGAVAQTASRGFAQVKVREALAASVGSPVVVSFDVLSPVDGTLLVYPYQSSGVSIADTVRLEVKGGAFARLSFPTSVKDYGIQRDAQDRELSSGSIGFYSTDEGMGAFVIRNVKIEWGMQATAWSFAPADEAAGRNLLPDSARERSSVNGFYQIPSLALLKDYVGSQITVSFEIKADASAALRLYAYQESGVSIAPQPGANLNFSVARPFQRVAFTVDVKDYGRQQTADGALLSEGGIALYNQAADHGNFLLRNLKIELGDRATAWSFAPGDPAQVSSREAALNYVKACREKKQDSFVLGLDDDTYRALTENQFLALRRMMIQAGYEVNCLPEALEGGLVSVRRATLSNAVCEKADTREELIALFRQAAEKNWSTFNVLVDPDLYNRLTANGWSELLAAEREGGVDKRVLSFYNNFSVLCYDDFEGGATAP